MNRRKTTGLGMNPEEHPPIVTLTSDEPFQALVLNIRNVYNLPPLTQIGIKSEKPLTSSCLTY